MYRSI